MAMPSKIKAASVRLPTALRDSIAAYAKDTGQTQHAAILTLLKRAFEKATPPAMIQPSGNSGQLAVEGRITTAPDIRAAAGLPERLPMQLSANSGQLLAPREILVEAEAKAAHLAKPKPKRKHAAWNLKAVPLGPVTTPAGSRLKVTTPKGGKR